jgi:hypothetical protein
MTGVRHAAAALSSLRREDQQWILSALPDPERRRLNRSLVELEASGLLPAETSNEPFMVTAEPAEFAGSQSPAERMVRVSAEQMHTVLDGEPPALIARFLLSVQWPWAPRFVATLSPRARVELDRALAHARPGSAPRLDAWLLDEVANRFAALERAGAVDRRRSHLRDAVIHSRVWRLSHSLLRKAATWIR